MNNSDVCEYVEKLKLPEKKEGTEDWFCQQCVEQGYGQTAGGYLASGTRSGSSPSPSLQKEHFLGYYRDRVRVTYQYLRCPELLLFIAQAAGVPEDCLQSAYDTLKRHEETNGLLGTKKFGNYMWGKPEFRVFKTQLHICEVVKIIKLSQNWCEVKKETKRFGNNPCNPL